MLSAVRPHLPINLPSVPCLISVILLCFCLTFNDAQAREGYIYGIKTDSRGKSFQRVNLWTGESEVLNKKLPVIKTQSHMRAAIDTRRNRYTFISGWQKLISLDLNSGEIIKQVAVVLPQYSGLEYDAFTDKYYFFTTDLTNTILTIDPETLEIGKNRFDMPNSAIFYCGTFVDGRRGLVMFFNGTGALEVYNISTGQKIQEVSWWNTILEPAYNATDGLVYGYQFTHENGYSQLIIDPISAEVQIVELDEPDWMSTQIAPCVNMIHSASQTHVSIADDRIIRLDLASRSMTDLPGAAAGLGHGVRVYNGAVDAGAISGHVYLDANENCTREPSETSMGGFFVDFGQDGYRAYSGIDGSFRATIPPGEYDVTLMADWPWQINCEASPRRIVIDKSSPEITGISVPATALAEIELLDISIVSGRAVVGRQLQYEIQVVNRGTSVYRGALNFQYPQMLQNFNAQPQADAHTAGLARWLINGLTVGGTLRFSVTLDVPPLESLRGQTFCAEAFLGRRVDDILAGTAEKICLQIRGSYDPNDMAVAPAGIGRRGNILPEDSTLTYTIRFQNIGDAPAYDIVILDTLDRNLDVNTLRFGAATHDYSVSLLAGNILEFRFQDIMLPGKVNDERGSQGALSFKVDLQKGLPLDTEIHNRAAIYFDFNAPIMTNTVVNTTSEIVTEALETEHDNDELELRSLANGLFVLHGSASLNGRLSVYSVLGRKVLEQKVQNTSQASIDLSSQPRGQYLIRYIDELVSFVRSVNLTR